MHAKTNYLKRLNGSAVKTFGRIVEGNNILNSYRPKKPYTTTKMF